MAMVCVDYAAADCSDWAAGLHVGLSLSKGPLTEPFLRWCFSPVLCFCRPAQQ